MTRYKCRCHPESAFHWEADLRDSIFVADKSMRAVGVKGRSVSQITAEHVQKMAKKGVHRTISGIARNREAELTRLRDFTVYSRANTKP